MTDRPDWEREQEAKFDEVYPINDAFKEFLAQPPITVDQVWVHDKEILDSVPRAPEPTALEKLTGYSHTLFGVPVYVKPDEVPPGCIEVRLDGKLVKRYTNVG